MNLMRAAQVLDGEAFDSLRQLLPQLAYRRRTPILRALAVHDPATTGTNIIAVLSAGNDITPASPLDVGASVDVVFHVGVQQGGNFRFFINVEATTNPAVPPKSNGAKLRAPTSKLHN